MLQRYRMITIEVNDRSVLDTLNRMVQGLGDATPVMADLANVLASESKHQVASQSGPLGPWPALSDVTKQMRGLRGTWPGRMLQVSSAGLAASVQTAHGPDWASIFTNKPYAAMHQFGGTTSARSMIPGKTIPARPYLPFNPRSSEITPEAQAAVLDVVNAWLSELTA